MKHIKRVTVIKAWYDDSHDDSHVEGILSVIFAFVLDLTNGKGKTVAQY